MTTIIGAGIAGLLAANVFQRAKVFEAGHENQVTHKAVLRFRSDAVGNAVGIDFRRVTVNKGLWSDDREASPSIRLANLYSQKVIGKLADRSIWNLAPAERFIAPEDFVQQLAERCGNRIEWNVPIGSENFPEGSIISTAPMFVTASLIGETDSLPLFEYAHISVRRWHVTGADVFQTIYFPDRETNLYRASITGNMLIAEYIGDADDYDFFPAFGITHRDATPHDSTKQRYGKIAPIDEQWRRNFILNATLQHGVYSIGRFATWRNVLADDVLKDIYVVKKLIDGDTYGAKRHSAK